MNLLFLFCLFFSHILGLIRTLRLRVLCRQEKIFKCVTVFVPVLLNKLFIGLFRLFGLYGIILVF